MNPLRLAIVVVLLGALALVPVVAQGQLLLSTNDNKVTLVNGAATVVKSPPADRRDAWRTRAPRGRACRRGRRRCPQWSSPCRLRGARD